MNKVSENPLKPNQMGELCVDENNSQLPTLNSQQKMSTMPLMAVTALFVTLYLVSNIMAVKVISIAGWFYFDAGTITFPFAYMLGDVLTEIWGYRTARKIIWLTFVCNIVMVLCTQMGVWLPSPDYLQTEANAYNTMFSYVPRIVIASLTGFLLGELSNAWLMDRIKRLTAGRWLWVRTIGSSMVGYFFDTVPFVLIAFLGVVSTHDLLMMLLFQYTMKLGIEAIFGTPMAYVVIRWIKHKFERVGITID